MPEERNKQNRRKLKSMRISRGAKKGVSLYCLPVFAYREHSLTIRFEAQA